MNKVQTRGLYELVMENRAVALALASYIYNHRISWRDVFRYSDLAPLVNMEADGPLDPVTEASIIKAYHRKRNFIFNRGMFADRLGPEDFANMVVVNPQSEEPKWFSFHDTTGDAAMWVHDIAVKLGACSPGDKVRPYYIWGLADLQKGAKNDGIWKQQGKA